MNITYDLIITLVFAALVAFSGLGKIRRDPPIAVAPVFAGQLHDLPSTHLHLFSKAHR